jgi:hypothetical protein
MAFELKGLCPRKKRSRLGPTRYFPRCKRCVVNGLEAGEHVGLCKSCQEEVFAILRFSSELARQAQRSA